MVQFCSHREEGAVVEVEVLVVEEQAEMKVLGVGVDLEYDEDSGLELLQCCFAVVVAVALVSAVLDPCSIEEKCLFCDSEQSLL